MAKEVAGLIKLQIKGGAAKYHGILQAIQRQNPGQGR